MRLNIRNILAYGYAKLLYLNGRIDKAVKEGLMGNHILSIYFHNPDKGLFEKCIKWLKRKGYKFLSVDELIQIRDGLIQFPKGGIIITVDDGWKENIPNIVMISKKESIPVTIFITAEPLKSMNSYWWSYVKKAIQLKIQVQSIEELKKIDNSERVNIINELRSKIIIEKQSMTITELKEINKYKTISIGSHTISHPILTKCSDLESSNEIKSSKDELEKVIEKSIKYFAYPNGNYGLREIENLKKNGYTAAFSTIPDYLTKGNLDKTFQYPRFEILENVSFAENICRITGVWFKKNHKIKYL
jgi:peptidoglycan/xylan/chitin deacetylase (PgdA/CDA1 family)